MRLKKIMGMAVFAMILSPGLALAATAGLTFAVNSVAAAPSSVQPGGSVDFSTTIVASQDAANYTVALQVFHDGTYVPSGTTMFTGLSFQAHTLVGEKSSWLIPAGTASGTYTLLAGVFDSQWNWVTGDTATFTVAGAATPLAGQCGGSNGAALTSAPTGSLCAIGSASAISGIGPWAWSCSGSNGGYAAQCSATTASVTKGVCGAAKGVAVGGAPTANLCSAGAASSVTGNGPWYWTCGSSGATAACSAPVYTATTELPGPSAALSASPSYACTSNFYVDGTNGNDSNPGTQARPWKTIQNADNGYPNTPMPGECVNVLPGTYTLSRTMVFSHGGNSNSASGYVVYRSTVPQAAHIVAGGNIGDLMQLWAGYLIFDGFDVDGNNSATSGHGIDGCANGGQPGNIAHHFTAINNVIHDMGGSGLSSCTADYITWVHNTVYNTSGTNQFEVSGINLWQPQALAGGSFNPTGADSVPFGIVIAYNIAHDNIELNNGHANHTDGNGIIIDTTLDSGTCPTCGTPYPGNILVAGNLAYNNGGGGIHVFFSENVTIANNTAYNNYLDTHNPGTARGELSSGGSQNITWINNIGYAVPGGGVLANNKPIVSFPVGAFPVTGSFTNNLAYGAPVGNANGSVVSPATNLIGVDPQLTNPAGGNFIPSAGSPVIGAGLPQSYIPQPTPDIGAY